MHILNKKREQKALSVLSQSQNPYLKKIAPQLKTFLLSKKQKPEAKKTSQALEPYFSDLIKKAIEQAGFFYPKLIIKTEILTDMKLPAFSDKVFQALWELIKNSAQALKQNQPSQIKIKTFMKNTNWFGCEVADKGPGMDRATMEKANQLYFSSHEKSAGLGLSLVQLVLSRMGGVIKMESPDSGGLKVSLFIPLDYIAYIEKLKKASNEH